MIINLLLKYFQNIFNKMKKSPSKTLQIFEHRNFFPKNQTFVEEMQKNIKSQRGVEEQSKDCRRGVEGMLKRVKEKSKACRRVFEESRRKVEDSRRIVEECRREVKEGCRRGIENFVKETLKYMLKNG